MLSKVAAMYERLVLVKTGRWLASGRVLAPVWRTISRFAKPHPRVCDRGAHAARPATLARSTCSSPPCSRSPLNTVRVETKARSVPIGGVCWDHGGGPCCVGAIGAASALDRRARLACCEAPAWWRLPDASTRRLANEHGSACHDAGEVPERVAEVVHREHCFVNEAEGHDDQRDGPDLTEQCLGAARACERQRISRDECEKVQIDDEPDEADLPEKGRDLRRAYAVSREVRPVLARELGQERLRHVAGAITERELQRILARVIERDLNAVEAADVDLVRVICRSGVEVVQALAREV